MSKPLLTFIRIVSFIVIATMVFYAVFAIAHQPILKHQIFGYILRSLGIAIVAFWPLRKYIAGTETKRTE